VQVYAVQFSTYSIMSKKAARWRRPAPEGSGFAKVDYQRADAYLHQVTEITGASVYPAANLTTLDQAVAAIAEELHNEYTVGYYPRVAGKFGEVRRLEIRVGQPWLVVRARTSYSFGTATPTREDARQVPATLSGSESVVTSHEPMEQTRPLDARWVCKVPLFPVTSPSCRKVMIPSVRPAGGRTTALTPGSYAGRRPAKWSAKDFFPGTDLTSR